MAPLPAREDLLQLATDLLRRSFFAVGEDHYLDDYRRSQWLPSPALRERQLAAVRRLAWHCFLDVPFYERRIGTAMAPSEIERLERLDRLPLVRPEERRREPGAFLARGTPEGRPIQAALRRRTAGTRGPAQPVFADHTAIERQAAVRRRAEEWTGAPPGRLVAAWGRESVRSPRPLAEAEVAALGIALRGAPGAVLSAPADSLPSLAGILGRARRPRALIARGPDRDAVAPGIAARTGAVLHRWYAVAEAGVVAATCERGSLHVQADHLVIEVVDDAGAALPAGAVGELVLTDLHNDAAPYLRHALSDRGRLLDRSCPCGRALPLLELVG